MVLCLTLFCCLVSPTTRRSLFFFFNDTATTEIYTLSLHDALPISMATADPMRNVSPTLTAPSSNPVVVKFSRSEEHTSELQSQSNLVCRLLLEKKKKKKKRMLVKLG